MKLALTTITIATLFKSTVGFSPVASKAFGITSRVAVPTTSTTAVFSEPSDDDDEEEGGLDLNLEEMFDM